MALHRLRPFAVTLILAGCSGDDLMLPGDGGAARIEIAAGDGQSGRVGAVLEDSIVVRVADATGRPVLGQPVTFSATDGEGAELVPETATTDASGLAGARWVLGRDVGTQRARAALPSASGASGPAVTFTASAVPGVPRTLAPVSGNGQSAPVGSTLPGPLVVRASDEFGNGVSGVAVSWTARGGGSVSPLQSTTDSDGHASARRTLGQVPGEQSATASVAGLNGSPVEFIHTATGGGGGGLVDDDPKLEIVSGNDQTAPAGATLPDPLVIRVVTRDGRGVGGLSVIWVVTAGGGSVEPVFGFTDANGRASTRWTLGPRPGSNEVSAIVTGVGTVKFKAKGTRGDDADDDADS